MAPKSHTRKIALLSRSRARRRSEGAAMFIVAVTLGLLAAMGVYGLTATAADVRAAGHERQAAQSQHAAELAIVMTSQILEPNNAQTVMNKLRAEGTARGTEVCRSAIPYTAADAALARDGMACLVLTPSTMGALAQNPASWPTATAPVTVPFSPESFGEVPLYPNIRVELTNPIDWEAPSGNAVGQRSPVFTQIRATVFVEMRPDPAKEPNATAETISVGRGRLVVGPYMP